MRIGIIALLHESNTFISRTTSIERFHEDLFLIGEPIATKLSASHHEIGGFFIGLEKYRKNLGLEVIPIVAFRATPSGAITTEAMNEMVATILQETDKQLPLDGILVAIHGAAVSESHPDADGYWLTQLRQKVGETIPIVGTLDAHANLTPAMVSACNALVAYRTNPHLDQRERGEEAARILLATLRGEVRPTMAAAFPPLVVNIERQGTSEPHWQPIYGLANHQLAQPSVLSNSILLGFPYSDVPEMGSATIVVTDNNIGLAEQLAQQLADALWENRNSFIGVLTDIEIAVEKSSEDTAHRYCLLDMGDNVGGGSAADGTCLLESIYRHKAGPAFACLYDPSAVQQCYAAGATARLQLSLGGHTDQQHGAPLQLEVRVMSLHEGRFAEPNPRHGGIMEFDQGPTAIIQAIDAPLTIMLTSKRMVPFSLQQLISCGVDPSSFHLLVAKGVHAPLAAYREVCDRFIRVNTPGSTCADLNQLIFHHRRKPLFPFESVDPPPK
jgi:microcystin degradation protein MlrC